MLLPQVPDKEEAKELMKVKGQVNLKGVAFSYNPEVSLIENLNLNVVL